MFESGKYIVLGKSNCPSCEMSKIRLTHEGLPFQYIDVEQNPDVLQYARDTLNLRSVPLIREPDGEWIGDYDVLCKYLRQLKQAS